MATSDQGQGGAATTESSSALPSLNLRRRDEHFAVVVSGRPPRAGHLPFQIAVPQELYHWLRYECLGSTNQVMVALVRQALSWLDAEKLTLRATVHPGPPPRSLEVARQMPDDLQGVQRREWVRRTDDLWPNARLDTWPRTEHWVVTQVERQPRVDAQLTQIALPPDVHQRLVHDGLGAVSQLVISLARYAMRRLDEQNLTLEVAPVEATARHAEATIAAPGTGTLAARQGPSLTVAQLSQMLSTMRPEALVVFEQHPVRWWNLRGVEGDDVDGDHPYPIFMNIDPPTGIRTPIVRLLGDPSPIDLVDEDAPDDDE